MSGNDHGNDSRNVLYLCDQMRLVMISALVPLCASFASIPKPDPKPYEPPEGQHLIRTHYQFEGVQYPITGLAPRNAAFGA